MANIIANRYQIDSVIGVGGMGKVFKAIDMQTRATVALKQIKSDFFQETLLERFHREGQALHDLNHPNIVKMLDSIEEDENHVLVMEYVSGGV